MSSSSYAVVSPVEAAGWGSAGSAVTTIPLSDSSIQEPDAEMGLGGAPVAQPVDPNALNQSKHKVAVFFHVLFKVLAVFVYLFCSFFFDSFILAFVTCVLLLSFDFWTVKNVTGRLLVGLRWWNEVREDGTNVWIFESKPDNRQIHPSDSFVFWGGVYITPVVWVLLGLAALIGLKFQWLLIVIVAVTLSGANLVGYWKCSKDQAKNVKSFIAARVLSAATGSPGA